MHYLVGIGTLYDSNYTVVSTKSSVTMFDSQDKAILTRWRKHTGTKIWRLYFRPQHQLVTPASSAMASLQAFSAYDISIVEALVCYLHAAAGLPVRSTWIAAIKDNNNYFWTGLTY